MDNDPKISAVDLFCGVGGLTQGLEKSGILVKAGIDIDPCCRYAYENNNRSVFIEKSVVDLKPTHVTSLLKNSEIRLLAGCAPCQPFSRYSLAASNRKHPKWSLLHEYTRLIKATKPQLVTMENVPDLLQHSVYDEFVKNLVSLRYKIWSQVVNCEEFGVPQARRRLVLLASRLGEIELIKPELKPKTVKDAIGKLPRISAGELSSKDPLHSAAELSPINRNRIRQSRPGGTWRDWDPKLVADCHKKESGKTYPSVYGRMRWDKPSPTITTQFYGYGNGRFGHPEQDRAISLREGSILQSFPQTYRFVPPDQFVARSILGRLIGNAVPPALGYAIGTSLVAHIREVGK